MQPCSGQILPHVECSTATASPGHPLGILSCSFPRGCPVPLQTVFPCLLSARGPGPRPAPARCAPLACVAAPVYLSSRLFLRPHLGCGDMAQLWACASWGPTKRGVLEPCPAGCAPHPVPFAAILPWEGAWAGVWIQGSEVKGWQHWLSWLQSWK